MREEFSIAAEAGRLPYTRIVISMHQALFHVEIEFLPLHATPFQSQTEPIWSADGFNSAKTFFCSFPGVRRKKKPFCMISSPFQSCALLFPFFLSFFPLFSRAVSFGVGFSSKEMERAHWKGLMAVIRAFSCSCTSIKPLCQAPTYFFIPSRASHRGSTYKEVEEQSSY